MANDTTEININQNADFEYNVQLLTSGTTTPIDITSWGFTASLKPKIRSPNVTFNFTCSIVNATTGSMKMTLSTDQTKELTRVKYSYDLIGELSGTVTRLLEGDAIVDLGVAGA